MLDELLRAVVAVAGLLLLVIVLLMGVYAVVSFLQERFGKR